MGVGGGVNNVWGGRGVGGGGGEGLGGDKRLIFILITRQVNNDGVTYSSLSYKRERDV